MLHDMMCCIQCQLVYAWHWCRRLTPGSCDFACGKSNNCNNIRNLLGYLAPLCAVLFVRMLLSLTCDLLGLPA
jgi:hypothetical protein